jgi:epoxyqueuosine reductase
MWGADYYGFADLTAAQDAILEQGGAEIAKYPRSISIGIALFHPIVNQLPRRQERAAVVGYRSHCYDIINARLDLIISRLASVLQNGGHRAYPVAASAQVAGRDGEGYAAPQHLVGSN